MEPDICIYHGPNCQDGFTAAWVIWAKWPEVEFHASQYGDAPPDVAGKHVLIVDFSYPKDVLDEMATEAQSITVLDHHKTAKAALEAYMVTAVRSPGSVAFHADQQGKPRIQAIFDMEKAGCRLAWEYAWPGKPAPMIVQLVEDRDLWKFSVEHTKEVCAWLFSWDYSFPAWGHYARQIEDLAGRARIVNEGHAILRSKDKERVELLDITARMMWIGDFKVPVANMPYTMASDAAGQLAEGNAFAATYFDRADGRRVFSLRSRGTIDVSEVAKKYGGGGHPGAAGFVVEAGWEGDPEPTPTT